MKWRKVTHLAILSSFLSLSLYLSIYQTLVSFFEVSTRMSLTKYTYHQGVVSFQVNEIFVAL